MKTIRQQHLEAIVEHLGDHDWQFGDVTVYAGKVHFYPEDLRTPDGTSTPGVVLFARRETADEGAYGEAKYTLRLEVTTLILMPKSENPLWMTEAIRGEVIEAMQGVEIEDAEVYYTAGDVKYPKGDDQTLLVMCGFNLEYYAATGSPYSEPHKGEPESMPFMVESDFCLPPQ